MSDHQLIEIRPRKDIAGANWHEVGCSCGWVRKYTSSYRCHVMREKHLQRKAQDRDGEVGDVIGPFFPAVAQECHPAWTARKTPPRKSENDQKEPRNDREH